MLIQSIRKKIVAKIRHRQRNFHRKKTIFPHYIEKVETITANSKRIEAPVSQASGGYTNVHKSFYTNKIQTRSLTLGLFFFSFVVVFFRASIEART